MEIYVEIHSKIHANYADPKFRFNQFQRLTGVRDAVFMRPLLAPFSLGAQPYSTRHINCSY